MAEDGYNIWKRAVWMTDTCDHTHRQPYPEGVIIALKEGGKMFAGNFKTMAKENANFRQVLHTGKYSQVVAMSILPGGDIGEETHQTTDQIFLIADGEGEAMVGSETREIEKKDLVFVPAGTLHNIKNTGDEDLKLITIYAPPAHPDGTVHVTKEEAMLKENTPEPNASL